MTRKARPQPVHLRGNVPWNPACGTSGPLPAGALTSIAKLVTCAACRKAMAR